MTQSAPPLVALLGLWGLACGAQSDPGGLDRAGHGRAANAADPARTAQTASASATASDAAPEASADVPFEEQGCPDAPEPLDDVTCDPLSQAGECGAGMRCTPYVQYPTAPCEPEVFGTQCQFAGTGLQGDSCIDEDCAAGYLCVASGQGVVCAELCASPGPNTCSAGFICGSVDLKGYGVCF